MVNCPVCKTSPLEPVKLEPGLTAHRCPECEGTWIPAANYWEWRDRRREDLPERTDVLSPVEVHDTQKAKLCPTCGHILLCYRVGHGIPFALKQCGHCNGVWCDSDEWEALKERNLHDNLHEMFAAPWQQRVRQGDRRAALERLYTEQFGAERYEEVQRVKSWLDAHPQRSMILAYLNNPDSYQT